MRIPILPESVAGAVTRPILGATVAPWRAKTSLMIIGVLLVQCAWILAVPPFRGSDEFDHAYRAAAVARGQWIAAPEDATRGTGAFVNAPPDILESAAPECWRLRYTGPEDCAGIGTDVSGLVRVASGAGRYNPVFYAAVGTAALPFEGASALYAMRIATALISLGLLAMALAAVRHWARTRWPYVSVALASTPVALYSTSVAAPNGVEIMAAICFWVSMIGLVEIEPAVRPLRSLVVIGAISGSVLVTLRALGPLWMGLILLTLLALAHKRRVGEILRFKAVRISALAVTLALVASCTWIVVMRSFVIGKDGPGAPDYGEGFALALRSLPLWLFQGIAAFPLRGEQAPDFVYASFLVLLFSVLVLALLVARRRERWVLLGVGTVSIAVPAAITTITYGDFGSAWQGRYGLPYAVGAVLLAGLYLDRRSSRFPALLGFLGLLLFVPGQVLGPLDVVQRELLDSPQAGSPEWFMPNPALVVALSAVGALLFLVGTKRSRGTTTPAPSKHVAACVHNSMNTTLDVRSEPSARGASK